MRYLIFIVLLMQVAIARGQMSIDTTRTSVIVKYQVGTVPKTLSLFRAYVPGQGLRYLAVYQPGAAEVGMEPVISRVMFADEAVHIKAMLDAALAIRPLHISRISINLLPYIDITSRLVGLYSNSVQWNAYVKKAGTGLHRVTTLMDGSDVVETAFDIKAAAAVFDSSDLLAELSDLFAPYGYTVTSGGFPDEHQQTVSTDKLMLLGKNPNLFVPVPNTFYNLVKIKK